MSGPTMRAAALRAAAAIDQDSFIVVLSGMEPDRHWRVRAALAETLGDVPGGPRDRARAFDAAGRGQARDSARSSPSLARLKASDLGTRPRCSGSTIPTSSSARRRRASSGELKPAGGAEALRQAYKTRAGRRGVCGARGGARRRSPTYGAAEARADARRRRSTTRTGPCACAPPSCSPSSSPPTDTAAATIAPAPGQPHRALRRSRRSSRPTTSPHVFIETAYGTIEFELAVLDAPQTSRNFMELARKGFFNGLEIHRVVAELRRPGRRSARRWGRRSGLHDSRRAQRAAVPARDRRHGARRGATPAAASSSSRTRRSRTSTRGTRRSATWSTAWMSSIGSSRAM